MSGVPDGPAVTVVMPFHNAAPYLAEAVESILRQTMRDFEFIMIDDASTDESHRIAAGYTADSRVHLLTNRARVGIAANLNEGLRCAASRVVARMDGDDVCEPDRLERQLTFLQDHPEVTVVGSYAVVIDEAGTRRSLITKPVHPHDLRRVVLRYPPFVHPSVMYRRDAVQAVGGYRSEYLYCEDADLWCRLLLEGYRGANIPEPLLRYRLRSGSTRDHGREVALKLFRLRCEMFARHGASAADVAYAGGQLALGVALSGECKQAFDWRAKRVLERFERLQGREQRTGCGAV